MSSMIMDKELEYKASFDSSGKPLDGNRGYKLHLPPNIPASNFWSVIVYDNQTRLMIHTDQSWPSVHSNCRKLVINQDGSMDIWFGPTAPAGKESNWVKTNPGKGWYLILRLYEPLQSWFDKTWKPGEIEEVR
jgi:hypothetical protein